MFVAIGWRHLITMDEPETTPVVNLFENLL